ncbi:SGNH/GDSL hydrolase family protein [Sulfitobacter sp.]|uniref:SGNH/GDSL hydrolase family protein n=1 Tax=Sulfitobacter sp. TaxID=1903071 RepID=UPI0030028F9B
MEEQVKRNPKFIAALCLVTILGLIGWNNLALTEDDITPSYRAKFDGPQPIVEPLLQSAERPLAAIVDPETIDFANLSQLKSVFMGRSVSITESVHTRASFQNEIQSFTHQWPAIYATANFEGDSVIVAFNDSINRYSISLDNAELPAFTVTRPGKVAVRISGLGSGNHAVRLDKISESLSGAAEFRGFFVSAGSRLFAPPDKKSREIEFIGDSDTVGYGNTSPGRDCEGDLVFLYTNTLNSFGPIVARHFNADYQVNAYSGIGLVRNLEGGNPEMTMTTRYIQALFDGTPMQQADGWSPQVIVLALGSNDFAAEVGQNEQWADQKSLRDDFETQYVRFLQRLRSQHPQALLVLIALKGYGDDYLAAHQFVQAHFASLGDKRVALAVLPRMQKTACHWHPSLEDHQMIAKRLINTINELPDVWPN